MCKPTSPTAVIVIGRNEGERLRRCLASVIASGQAVVYVDSDSSDGSPALARSLGAEVVQLDMSIPFSAARARNSGVERAIAVYPETQFVQFVDGDCEMIPGWIDHAQATMKDRPELAAVCGRLRERFPQQSIYNRLADLEWDTPTGEVQSCGGIAMMRLESFQAVGGFDPSVVAGEEPELCQRFRQRGWKILRLPDEMALHDAAMLRFSQWWRRSVRSGYGAMDVAARFGHGKDGLFRKQIRSARTWAMGWPAAVVVAAVAAGLLGGPRWGAMAALGVGCLPFLQIARLAARARPRLKRPADAAAHGALGPLGKWANLLGQIRCLRDHAAGRNSRLIEYKRNR